MASGVIPIVDFSVFSVEKEVLPSECDESVKRLAAELHEAFSTIGFVYLKGHGVAEGEVGPILFVTSPPRHSCLPFFFFQISEIRNVGDQFFTLPTEVKERYQRPSDGSCYSGWVPLERERSDNHFRIWIEI